MARLHCWSIGFLALRRSLPLSPNVGEYANGTDAEENEVAGFGHGCQQEGMTLPNRIDALANDQTIVVNGPCP